MAGWRIFHKLLINFSWWINRKDADGSNVFEGGFLGLDNIGLFDRSAPLPGGARLEQSDATSWMAMFCLNMLAIAMELAHHDAVYEDTATKFFEHFLAIANAINNIGDERISLWDEDDGFFYTCCRSTGGSRPCGSGRWSASSRCSQSRPWTRPCLSTFPTSRPECGGSSRTGPIWPATSSSWTSLVRASGACSAWWGPTASAAS